MTALVRQADPRRWDLLTGTIGALSVRIGSIFIPVVDLANQKLEMLLGWFQGLSDEQKESILRWTEVGVAVAGVLMILPKVIAGISAAGAAFEFLGIAEGTATAGILPIIGLVASLAVGLGGLGLVFGQTGDEADKAGQQFGQAGQAAGQAAGVFGQAGDQAAQAGQGLKKSGQAASEAGTAFAGLGSLLGMTGGKAGLLSDLMAKVSPVLKAVENTALGLWQALQPLWNALGSVATQVINGLVQQFQAAQPGLKAMSVIVATVGQVLGQVFESLKPSIAAFFDLMKNNAATFAGLWQKLAVLVIPILKDLGNLVAVTFKNVIGPALEVAATVLSTVIDFWVTVIGDVIEAVGEWQDIVVSAFEAIADALGIDGNFIGQVFAKLKEWASDWSSIIQGLKPVIKDVFDFLIATLEKATRSFIYFSTIAQRLANRHFTGNVEAAEAAVRDFDEKLKQRKDERQKTKEEVSKGLPVTKAKPHDFTPAAVSNKAPELVGIADFWKKAQQAVQTNQKNTAEQERAKEMANNTRRSAEYLKQLVEKDEKKAQVAPAMFGQ